VPNEKKERYYLGGYCQVLGIPFCTKEYQKETKEVNNNHEE
jgi:hypothetical protein